MDEIEDEYLTDEAKPPVRLVAALAVTLLVAGGLIVAGVSLIWSPAGFIVGGILLGVWALVTLAE